MPAVLRTEDFARVWLNGVQVAEFESNLGLYGWALVPKSYPVTLPLKAGDNRLLVKFTSLHNADGFAFHIPALSGLTDLKPRSAKVGWRELYVNQNYEGKPLEIGGQPCARGFWAHAPSEVGFELDGGYEWLETTIGLDSLASASGSVEFQILDAP